MKTVNNIGFNSGLYDTRVTRRTKKQTDEQGNEETPKSNKIPLMVPKDNEYIKVIMKAFNQFIIDECVHQGRSDGQFKASIEAARQLFPGERERIEHKSKNPFFQYDTYNTEVVFY